MTEHVNMGSEEAVDDRKKAHLGNEVGTIKCFIELNNLSNNNISKGISTDNSYIIFTNVNVLFENWLINGIVTIEELADLWQQINELGEVKIPDCLSHFESGEQQPSS